MVAALVACHKKGIPEMTDRKAPLPKMVSSVYPPKETVAPDTLAGRAIFAGRCSRCHALPQAGQFNAVRWDEILPVMIPRARLDNEQALHLRAYLLSQAAK